MASLRREPRGKSPFWYACITTPDKGQTQRSTGIKASERTRSEAMAIAERWERQAKQLAPALHLKNRDAILETFVTATQKAVSGEMTEATAREMLDRILEATGQNAVFTESVREFSGRWMNAQQVGLAKTSRIAYRHAIRLFVEHLGELADKPMRVVLPHHIETFRASRISTGRSAKTVDRDLKIVRAIFGTAIKQGQLTFDPTQTVSLVSRKRKSKEQQVSREIFTPSELDAILAAATGDWLTVTLFGRYTGARISDCAQMRWENVNLAEETIAYTDKKTGKDYLIPTHKRLQEHLLTLAGSDDPERPISPSLAGRGTGGDYGLSKLFQKIMQEACVDTMRVDAKSVQKIEGKKARTFTRRSFHSIRHSYNSELANAQVPQEVRRKLIGHSGDEMNDIYTHLEKRVFRQAIDTLS